MCIRLMVVKKNDLLLPCTLNTEHFTARNKTSLTFKTFKRRLKLAYSVMLCNESRHLLSSSAASDSASI